MAWGVVELEPEVEKWLESLPIAQFAHAAFYVDLPVEQGPLLGEPYTEQLDRKLRELRFHLERQAVFGGDRLGIDGFPVFIEIFHEEISVAMDGVAPVHAAILQ